MRISSEIIPNRFNLQPIGAFPHRVSVNGGTGGVCTRIIPLLVAYTLIVVLRFRDCKWWARLDLNQRPLSRYLQMQALGHTELLAHVVHFVDGACPFPDVSGGIGGI